MASNDCGDISWVVPMGRVWFPSNIPHAAFHHWSAGAALTTSIAHKGALAGAKAAVRVGARLPDVVRGGRRSVADLRRPRSQVSNTSPLLPADQKPPVELNRALMERYRPLMEPHYLQGPPDSISQE